MRIISRLSLLLSFCIYSCSLTVPVGGGSPSGQMEFALRGIFNR